MDESFHQEGLSSPGQPPEFDDVCLPGSGPLGEGVVCDGTYPDGKASYWLVVSRPLGAVTVRGFDDVQGLQEFVRSASRELVEDGCRVVVFHGRRLDIRRRPAAFDLVGEGGNGVLLYEEPETDLNPDPPEGA